MMYSAGIVQSASSSNSQYPAAFCRATNASRAVAMERSRRLETVLVSVCDTMSARAFNSAPADGAVFSAMRFTSRNSRKSGGGHVR